MPCRACALTMSPTGPSIGIEYPIGLTVRSTKDAIRIGGEYAAIVDRGGTFLDVVETVGAGLPDRNGRVGERPAVDVADAAIEHALAAGLHGFGDLAAGRQVGEASR